MCPFAHFTMFKIVIERKVIMNQAQIDEITKNVARTVERNVLWYALGIGSPEKTDSGDNKASDSCYAKNNVQP